MARKIPPRVKPGTEDFEILFSEFSVVLSGERYSVHEYSLTEGFRMCEAARKAVTAYSKDNELEDLLYVLAQNCERDPFDIAGLSESDLSRLIVAFQKANKKWLVVEEPDPRAKYNPETWSAIVQTLISEGHTLAQIRQYTLRQVLLFYSTVHRLDSRRRIKTIVDTSMGFAGGDSAKEMINSLKKAGT